MNEPLNHELLSFIGKSPTVFHAVDTMKARLSDCRQPRRLSVL